MSKKRTIVMTETRRIYSVAQLKDWLYLLPSDSMLRDIRSFDGDTTIQWEELQ